MDLYEKFGDEDYDGEPVSQTSHMIQCALEAIAEGDDNELILGSFLHDIGYLLKHVILTTTFFTLCFSKHSLLSMKNNNS